MDTERSILTHVHLHRQESIGIDLTRTTAGTHRKITTYTYTLPSSGDEETPEFVMDMATSVRAVENLLGYEFKNKKLLEDALTHPSYTESTSYQRLEFVGDAALGLAFSNYVYLAYPDLEPGDLSLLRAANVSTEKLARVAVKHGLHRYIRHNASSLDDKVRDFTIAVRQEVETEVYGGVVKAPKILADIVESVAAAVYVDCGFDLEYLWMISAFCHSVSTSHMKLA